MLNYGSECIFLEIATNVDHSLKYSATEITQRMLEHHERYTLRDAFVGSGNAADASADDSHCLHHTLKSRRSSRFLSLFFFRCYLWLSVLEPRFLVHGHCGSKLNYSGVFLAYS